MKPKLDLNAAQLRSFKYTEVRAQENSEEAEISGHAAVYNSRTTIGDCFDEIIMPGAFNETDLSEVFLCVNHQIESQLPLAKQGIARGKDDTLKVVPDEKGLKVDAKLDIKNNVFASALYSNVKRGINDTMSLMFWVDKEEWDDLDSDRPLRRILKISKVLEVSVVNLAAYKATEINARGGLFVEANKHALENARNLRSAQLAKERELELYKAKIRIQYGG